MQYNQTQKNKKAFVIIIAVLVASLLVSLGAFIANIAQKELSLSSSGRDSQIAFYVADAAIECALYHDLHVSQFATSTADFGAPTSLNCLASTTDIILQPSSDADTGVSFFEASMPLDPGNDLDFSPYVQVQVTKDQVGTINETTVIEAHGYNIKSTNSTRRVERALRVNY